MSERLDNARATIWKYGRSNAEQSAVPKIIRPVETVNLSDDQGVMISEHFSRPVVTGIETLDGEVEAETQMGMLDAWASLCGNRLTLSLANGDQVEGGQLTAEPTEDNKNPHLVLHLKDCDTTLVAMITTGLLIDAADKILEQVFAQAEKTTDR